MSSDEETPSLRARARARRSSGSRRMVVGRLDAIQAIYVIQAPMVKPDPYDKSRTVSPNCPGAALSVARSRPRRRSGSASSGRSGGRRTTLLIVVRLDLLRL